MPRSYLTNAVDVALAQPVQPGDGSIIVDDAAPLPATPFYLVIDPFSDTDREYCYCTNVTGTTLTVTRNLDGSQGQIHGATDIVRISYVAQILDDLWDAVSAATGLPVGGVLGDSLRKASSSAGDGEWRDNMFFGATAPSSPMVGDLWHNPADNPSTDFLPLSGGAMAGPIDMSGSYIDKVSIVAGATSVAFQIRPGPNQILNIADHNSITRIQVGTDGGVNFLTLAEASALYWNDVSSFWQVGSRIWINNIQQLAEKQFRNITVGSGAPASPTVGDIWLDIS